ncbi:MAG: ATP-binding protein [Lachnospiraceae bacterium]|nr:ATP-binding protein [Lachnospiraceae bacterium]
MYIERHIDNVLRKAEKQTKVVLLTGPRQVGKSTTIQKVFPEYTYITLDDENELYLALNDSQLFFRDRHFPVIIDEVQYAGNLLRTIKLVSDKLNKKGQIFITGSQTYELMSLSAETLAGRISVIEMNALSARESYEVEFYQSFIPSAEYINLRGKEQIPYTGLWQRIHRGFYPDLEEEERDWEWFYRDYIRTYLERDVRRIVNVRDEMKFRSLLTSIAARSGQLLIYEDIARDVGIDLKTAQHWISVISASGLIKIIHPYHNNAISRAVKTPKLYFMDTGLLCYLVGWKTYESACNGAMSGSIFETFVISEIIKSYLNVGKTTNNLYYYRDKDKKEIDLLIEEDNTLYPVEIKKGANISRDWIKNFGILDRIKDKAVGPGAVICQTDHPLPINDKVTALPVEYL